MYLPCHHKNLEGCYNVAQFYEFKWFSKYDLKKAIEMYQQICQKVTKNNKKCCHEKTTQNDVAKIVKMIAKWSQNDHKKYESRCCNDQ